MKKNNLKKMFVKSYGCQMNVYDSEKITSILENKGMTEKEEAINADIVIFNTLALTINNYMNVCSTELDY